MRCVRREAEATEIATLFVKSDSKNREALESRRGGHPRRSEACVAPLDAFLDALFCSLVRLELALIADAQSRLVLWLPTAAKRSSAARVTQSTGYSCTRPNDAVAGALPPPA